MKLLIALIAIIAACLFTVSKLHDDGTVILASIFRKLPSTHYADLFIVFHLNKFSRFYGGARRDIVKLDFST